MRFRTTAKVKVQDSERVLAVLEQRLRAMVSDVERDGNRITLSGLGPSSRAVNRHDTTVIDVWAEDGETTIGADVSFQASAFLGTTGQEEIMRLKLERLFAETEEQLDLESRHDAARIARIEALTGSGSVAAKRPERQQQTSDASSSGRAASTKERDEALLQKAAAAGRSANSSTKELASARTNVEDEGMIDDDELLDDDDEKSNRWMLWAVLAALVAAALPSIAHYASAMRADKVAPVAAQAAASPPAASAPAEPVAAAEPADLLRQWELAMQSRDAAAQAAFYAVPVERYFLNYNVGKEQVQADKQQRIDSRRGQWAITMEKVRINRNTDTTATVSLVKHYTQKEEGRPVKQWSVPSQLKLKNEYGVWWITSERDFFPRPSSVEP